MRYISYLFIILAGLWGGIFPARADDALESEKIYFFTYDGCPYCRQADEYITKNHPALAMEKIDIYKPGGMYLFKKCAEKFKLGRNIGTPLFCMGDDYIMGWSDENQKGFDELSTNFQK